MIVKTPSLVLRRLPFSESSQIATLLTRDLGRVQVLAKGIRRKKPAEQGSLDLLTVGQSVIYYKQAKGPGALHLLSENAAFQQWYHLRRDLDKIHAGYYLAELAMRLLPPEAPDAQLFRLFCRGLVEVSRARTIRPVLDSLILRALVLTGELPALDRCAGCGAPARQLPRLRFDGAAGGLLCARCPAVRQPVELSHGTLALLGHLLADGATPERVTPAPDQAREIGRLFAQLTRQLFERPMRMERLLIGGMGPRPLISHPIHT